MYITVIIHTLGNHKFIHTLGENMDIKKLKKASQAVYLACEKEVADDISGLLLDAEKEISMLRSKVREQNKVFLGGTCNESTWRTNLIPLLEEAGIDYFNPVVEDWTPECQEEERRQKQLCNIHLYVITKEMTGVFSIAEAVDSAWQKGIICIFQVYSDGFSKSQLKSFDAVVELIDKKGQFASVNPNINYPVDVLSKGESFPETSTYESYPHEKTN